MSLNDVAEAAGLSKSGLFKHFESKEGMQEALLIDTGQRFLEFVWKPAESLPPGRARLERVFDLWMDWDAVENAVGGCLIMTASVELADQPGPLRDLVQGMLKRWNARLEREMQALTEPALSEEAARMGMFQMNSYILGHHQSARFLGELDARAAARASFLAMLDRLSAPAAALA